MLFLSDLDGTLINSAGEITKLDWQAIQKYTKKNSFGFVTGRDEAFCRDLISKYNLSCDCVIANNGATAYWKGKCVYSSLMDVQESISICKKIIELNEVDLFYTDQIGNRYYPIDKYGMDRMNGFLQYQPNLRGFCDKDLIAYLKTRKEGCAKFSLFVKDKIDDILYKYKALFAEYEVMQTSKDYIEITKKGINKWIALKHLPEKEAAFIGDGLNDLCILKNVTSAYVMNHAPESVKKYGVCVCNVAKAIEIEMEKEHV